MPPLPPDVAPFWEAAWEGLTSCARAYSSQSPIVAQASEAVVDAVARVRSALTPDQVARLAGEIRRIAGLHSRVPASQRTATISRALRNGSQWRNFRMGSTFFVLIIVVVEFILIGGMSYLATKAYLKRRDLDVKATEDAAYLTLLENMAKSMRAGRVKLLPGVTEAIAVRRIRENMEVGRAPLLNVLEVRPAPDLSGSWEGDLVVKDIQGSSNIPMGFRRPMRGGAFQIRQEENLVHLTVGGNQISGYFTASETIPSQVGGRTERMEVDTAVLREGNGTVVRAELTYYGLGAGSLRGKLKVEIEQKSPNGAIVTSGGLLNRR